VLEALAEKGERAEADYFDGLAKAKKFALVLQRILKGTVRSQGLLRKPSK
jgi:hypothetical protein